VRRPVATHTPTGWYAAVRHGAERGAPPRATCEVSVAVRIRPLEDGEAGPVLAVFDGLGVRSREQRFLAPKLRLTRADLRHLTHVDGVDRVGLVAERPDGRPVGIARFVRDRHDPSAADVAVAVVDRWQRRGIGKQLAAALGAWARRVGVRRFTVDMLRDNQGAVRLMRHAGGDVHPVGLDDYSAEFEIALADEGSASFSGELRGGGHALALDRRGGSRTPHGEAGTEGAGLSRAPALLQLLVDHLEGDELGEGGVVDEAVHGDSSVGSDVLWSRTSP